MERALAVLQNLPEVLIHLLLAVGAGIENIVPPVPADTFAFVGGVIASRGLANVWIAAGATWAGNVTSAVFVYVVGRRYGRSFFQDGWGRRLLNPAQLDRVQDFYDRWGIAAVFFTRLLPGLRAVVPVFAGVTHQRFLPVFLPLATASALWYGALVWLGFVAGRNLRTIWTVVSGVNRGLLIFAILIFLGVGIWWWRTRRARRHQSGRGAEGHAPATKGEDLEAP